MLGYLKEEACAASLDKVVLFSKGDLVSHWSIVKKGLNLCNDVGLKLDPKKNASL